MAYYNTISTTLNLGGLTSILYQWGLTTILIPFILIFTLIFALLQKIKIFKKKKPDGSEEDAANKKISTLISLGIAATSLIPHFTGQGFDIVLFINSFLPNSFLLLFVILLFLAILGTVSTVQRKKPSTHPFMGIIAIIAVFTLVVILLQSVQIVNYPFLYFLNDPNTQAIAIVILVLGLVIWYIGKKETPTGTTPPPPLKGLIDMLEKTFGK